MSESDYFAHAKSIVTEASRKLSPVEYIRSETAVMPRDEVDHLAAAYLLSQVKMRQRRVVLGSERNAERSTPVVRTPPTREQVESARKYEAEKADIEDRRATRLWAAIADATDKYAKELRMEWTRELLEAEFALGDGTTVRWGDATREQHEYRFQLHSRNAAAGIEGAARHKQALDALELTGATTLREAVAVAA